VRLSNIHIYGFGKLSDLRLSFHSGLNIIEGKNEAGKSTIMAFIRAILFGFEGRRLGHLRYEPLQGGKFGGVIELISEDKKLYKVERVYYQRMAGDVRVILPNGEIAGEAYLPNIIGQINEKVFKQIFSFGLNELQQIDSLQDDQINDYILHSGTGVVNQILKIRQHLDQQEQHLFKPTGRKPVINSIIPQMDEITEAIKQKKLERDAHHSNTKQIEEIDQQIVQKEKKIALIKQDLTWFEKGLHYFNQYEKIKQIEQRLLEYPTNMSFPENGIERYEAFSNQILDLELERQQLIENYQVKENELLQLSIEQSILEKEEQIERLKESLSLYQSYKQSNIALNEELNQLNQSIENHHQHLGPDFTEEKILAIEYTIQDKHDLQLITNQLQDKKQALYEKEKDIGVKNNRLAQLDNIIEDNESIYNKIILNEVDELKLYQDYKVIKGKWQQISDHIWQRKQLIEQQESYELQLKEFIISQSNHNKVLVIINTLLYILAGVMLNLSNSFLGLSLILISILFSIFVFKKYKTDSPHIRTIKDSLKQTTDTILVLDESDKKGIKQLEEIIGFYGYKSWKPAIIQELEQLIGISNQEKQERSYIETKKKDAIIERTQLLNESKVIENERSKIQDELSQLKIDLKNWLINHQLPQTLPITILSETLSLIQSLKELIKKRLLIHKNIEKNKLAMREYEDNLRQVFQEIGLNYRVNIEENVFLVSNRLKVNQENKVERDYLSKQLLDSKEKISLIDKKLNQIKSKLDELLSYANANDQEHFYKKAKQFIDYKNLSDEKQNLLYSINSSCVSEQDFNKILDDLASKTLDEWEDSVSINKELLTEENELLKQSIEQKGEIQNRIKELERDKGLSELNQDYENLKTELNKKVLEWTTARITKHLLNKTIQLYEMEKQPKVIKKATYYFNHLTGGKYVKIVTPIGTNDIETIDVNGQRFQPQYLSRGTIEQLFLAMRFALVDEFSQKINLPIILDDILVNFDQNRMGNAFSTINKLGEQHQVLFFTCHESLADTYTKVVGGKINHIVLED